MEIPTESNEEDHTLWKQGEEAYKNSFNTGTTWKQLRQPSPTVPWWKAVWFKRAIPKHALIQWQASLGRLSTKDRLHRWGLQAETLCNLCSAEEESHQHLFFECSFSSSLWLHFANRLGTEPPLRLHLMPGWIEATDQGQNRYNHHRRTLTAITLQAAAYMLWRERNDRIFRSHGMPNDQLKHRLDRLVRNIILTGQSGPHQQKNHLLQVWFYLTRPP
ncbi:PREDICTED: uncharacterized protein LOC104798663 [Tarenaya hassleriana]|uniref:uncharacterized protein LOC104798663 n=1 Tax=Tarenaya hassleriana TaxID=28532 RepID=UPI00053C209A|nr:PREDICTED: uncharacterized protein LOC104798663 [Tarenaya hassleriana]